MRSISIFRLGIPALTFLAFATLQSMVLAQTATPPTTTPLKSEKQELLKQLHRVHHLLSEADKDYDGHRKAAAEAVHKAIHELEGKHHKKPAGTAKDKPKGHEKQANSDAQLAKALAILQKVQGEVNTAKHPKASEHVSTAITEINTALKIK